MVRDARSYPRGMSVRHVDNMDGWCESEIKKVRESPATLKIQIKALSSKYYHNTVLLYFRNLLLTGNTRSGTRVSIDL